MEGNATTNLGLAAAAKQEHPDTKLALLALSFRESNQRLYRLVSRMNGSLSRWHGTGEQSGVAGESPRPVGDISEIEHEVGALNAHLTDLETAVESMERL